MQSLSVSGKPSANPSKPGELPRLKQHSDEQTARFFDGHIRMKALGTPDRPKAIVAAISDISGEKESRRGPAPE